MAEKETTETKKAKKSDAERVMLTMSSTLKETIEAKSKELGISTTQYIMNLIINDIKGGKVAF